MNKRYTTIIHPTDYHRQALGRLDSHQTAALVSEDDKVTRRLPTVSSDRSHLLESEAAYGGFSGSLLRAKHVERQQPQGGAPEALVSELDLASLSAGDQLVIETAHSIYSFTVSDPTTPSGRLMGGVLGNRLVNAALIPSRSASGPVRLVHNDLGNGAKMIFIIEQGHNLRRLTTSAVMRLLHRKPARSRRIGTRRQTVWPELILSD